MKLDEYRQLRAYARYDGIYLAILWTASFACLIFSPSYPVCSMLFMLLAISTPFFVAYRLWKFRKEGRDDQIGFKQALHYCLRVFFNAAVFFALVQWAYMSLLDNGQMALLMQTAVDTPETIAMMEQVGYSEELIKQALAEINNMSPMTFAATYFINNIIIGTIASLPIAVVMKKQN